MLPVLVVPICVKRFQRRYSGQPALNRLCGGASAVALHAYSFVSIILVQVYDIPGTIFQIFFCFDTSIYTDYLHFSPSCSMVVTLHDHITSVVVFCNMYLCLIISHVRAPHWHGKIMVTTWLHLSIEMFQVYCDPCTITHHEAKTRCIPHLKIVLYTTPIINNIKSARRILTVPGR